MKTILILATTLLPLHAANVTWTGDFTGDWYGGTAALDTSWDNNGFPLAGDHVFLPTLPFFSGVTLAGTAGALGPLGSLNVGGLPFTSGLGDLYFPVLTLEDPAALSTTGEMLVATAADQRGEVYFSDTVAATITVGTDLTIGSGANAEGKLTNSFTGSVPNATKLSVVSETFLGRAGGRGFLELTGSIFETGSLFAADVDVESEGHVTLAGVDLTVADRFEIGVTGFGTFDCNGFNGYSTMETKDSIFGSNQGSEGTGSIQNTEWNLAGILRAGIAGDARVQVGDNAAVTITTPGDFPSIIVGESATSGASLSIEIYGDAGGFVTANHQAVIGLNSPNAELTCGGAGSLTTGQHTSPTGSSCIFGANFGSSGRGILRQGGQLIGDGATVVGFAGDGYLEAEGYGRLKCADLVVAREPGATGTVMVSNDGEISLTDDNELTRYGGCYIGGSPLAEGGAGEVTLDLDGKLFAESVLLIHSTGILHTHGQNGDGRCLIGTDDFVTPILADTVNLRADGTVKGRGLIDGDLVATGGRVEPGLSAGKLRILQDATLSVGSRLAIEIGGTTPATQHDVLGCDGTFNFDGFTLDVDLTGGFVPSAGQVFKVIDAGTYAGSSITIDLSGAVLPSPLTWNTGTVTTDGTLRVSGPPPAGVAITAIRRVPGTDDIELTIRGTAGVDYFIEASLNLMPPWSDISGPRVATGADEIFPVPGTIGAHPKRFFRLND